MKARLGFNAETFHLGNFRRENFCRWNFLQGKVCGLKIQRTCFSPQRNVVVRKNRLREIMLRGIIPIKKFPIYILPYWRFSNVIFYLACHLNLIILYLFLVYKSINKKLKKCHDNRCHPHCSYKVSNFFRSYKFFRPLSSGNW